MVGSACDWSAEADADQHLDPDQDTGAKDDQGRCGVGLERLELGWTEQLGQRRLDTGANHDEPDHHQCWRVEDEQGGPFVRAPAAPAGQAAKQKKRRRNAAIQDGGQHGELSGVRTVEPEGGARPANEDCDVERVRGGHGQEGSSAEQGLRVPTLTEMDPAEGGDRDRNKSRDRVDGDVEGGVERGRSDVRIQEDQERAEAENHRNQGDPELGPAFRCAFDLRPLHLRLWPLGALRRRGLRPRHAGGPACASRRSATSSPWSCPFEASDVGPL